MWYLYCTMVTILSCYRGTFIHTINSSITHYAEQQRIPAITHTHEFEPKKQLILTNSQQQSSTHFHIAFRSVWCNICRYCNTKIVAYYGVSKSKPRTSLFWVDGLLRFCVHENKTSPCPYHFSSEVEEANEEFTTINSTVNKQILLEPIPPNLRHKLISSLIEFWHATTIKTNAILGIHAIMWNTCETWCCHLYSFCLI